MRRLRLNLFLAMAALSLAPAPWAHAQYGGRGGGQDQQAQDDAKSRKRKEEFGSLVGPLPALRNAGPCPFVKTLYDAARYMEFKDNVEASANVGYTGEIQKIASACAYTGDQPIKVEMRILFELGRGPQAEGDRKIYRYWVAVTDRNHAVLGKEYFNLPVNFPRGADRTSVTDTLKDIVIPRADTRVSGANFEVLIGFDVTPAMAEFNRQGKRFKANAGQTTQASAATP
ncbi:MAG TPA: Tat pathway signal sequence domain protein [Caulobacteraceae bacterium]|jgi:hypothetical protein